MVYFLFLLTQLYLYLQVIHVCLTEQQACWPHREHVRQWLPAASSELQSPPPTHASLSSILQQQIKTKLSCILSGPAWLRNSWRERTQKISSGAHPRESTSSQCTQRWIQRDGRMNYQECFHTLEGPILPCILTDLGQSGSMLALVLWRRATNSIKTTSKVVLFFFFFLKLYFRIAFHIYILLLSLLPGAITLNSYSTFHLHQAFEIIRLKIFMHQV